MDEPEPDTTEAGTASDLATTTAALLPQQQQEASILPNPRQPIPERLKADNWAFFVLSQSDDPVVKCLNTRNLVRNLKTTMRYGILLNHPYFDPNFKIMTTIGLFMDYNIKGANKASNAYSQGRTGEAVELANAVLDAVQFIVYDERFTKTQANSFTGRKT